MLDASEQPARESGISTVFSGLRILRGLRHEVHAALHDGAGLHLAGLDGELQRVADDIGDAVKISGVW
jgi:hypothetical protein